MEMRLGLQHSPSKGERGQSLVEMTIGFVILTLIVMGILDLGRAYFLNLALEDAAGEAALYLSINPACPTAQQCRGMRNAQYRALNSGGGNVDWSSATFEYAYKAPGAPDWSTTIPTTVQSGTLVRVSIAIPFQVLTPVVSTIARGQSLTLSSYAISTVVM